MTKDSRFPTEVQEGGKRPPDLNDMFVSGLPLRRAVAFERAIEENPDIPAEDWWKTLRSFASEATPIEFP